MNPNKHVEGTNLKQQVAPLIDVVFLLLIYFMVTSSLIKKEGDVAFQWPARDLNPVLAVPVEAYISIAADGTVTVDGMVFSGSDRRLDGLSVQVAGLQRMAEEQHSSFLVTLAPEQEVLHYRILDVMDACAGVKVRNLSFARTET